MRLQERLILHFTDSKSDKVYIMDVMDHEGTPSKYSLISTWGRRTSPRLSNQIKCDVVPYEVAMEEYNNLSRSKIKSGYVVKSLREIDIPGYSHNGSGLLSTSTINRKEDDAVLPDVGRLTRGIL